MLKDNKPLRNFILKASAFDTICTEILRRFSPLGGHCESFLLGLRSPSDEELLDAEALLKLLQPFERGQRLLRSRSFPFVFFLFLCLGVVLLLPIHSQLGERVL